jgi:hypothetical protein
MLQATDSHTANLPVIASAVPASYAVHHSGWIPVIDHPDRTTPYVREERFPRKVKATAIEAIEYARRTIHYRQIRKNEKRRHREAVDHPRFFLQAAE